MEWEEIFKKISSKEMEDAEEDIDWILTALRDPTYLMVKGDNSNQFLLKHSNIYYVEYVKKVLEERGFILKQAGRFSNAVSVISEREFKERAFKNGLKVEPKQSEKQGGKTGENQGENLESKIPGQEGIEPND